MATYSTPIAALRPLALSTAHGWPGGFANLLRKEHGLWWGTRKWLAHIIIWLVILNGLIALVTVDELSSNVADRSAISQEVAVYLHCALALWA
jgi:hypothetical protein